MAGGGQSSIVFSPNITITGNASRADVDASMQAALQELRTMLARMLEDNGRRAMV
jgi:hypothetical protein